MGDIGKGAQYISVLGRARTFWCVVGFSSEGRRKNSSLTSFPSCVHVCLGGWAGACRWYSMLNLAVVGPATECDFLQDRGGMPMTCVPLDGTEGGVLLEPAQLRMATDAIASLKLSLDAHPNQLVGFSGKHCCFFPQFFPSSFFRLPRVPCLAFGILL